ncbi:MAG: hypothetical protein WD669_03360 [Pirellulales bacterium]
MATAPTTASPRRRWFRYSLRTFFLLITAVCIALGLYVKRQRDRYVAIEKIKTSGGFVEFVKRTGGGSRYYPDLLAAKGPGQTRAEYPEEQPTGKPWMQQMLGKYGKYHGSRVVSITLGRTILSPKDAVFDIGVLAPLNEVQELLLTDSFDDDDLARLPRLPELERLQMSMLEGISDRGLTCLDRMPNLTLLQVSIGNFTAEGLAHIGSRHKLTRLMLSSCDLSDDSLVPLAELPGLTSLFLADSTISDAAVPHLAQLRGLKQLIIVNTNITEEGVKKLRESLPKCQIHAQFEKPSGLRERVVRERQKR